MKFKNIRGYSSNEIKFKNIKRFSTVIRGTKRTGSDVDECFLPRRLFYLLSFTLLLGFLRSLYLLFRLPHLSQVLRTLLSTKHDATERLSNIIWNKDRRSSSFWQKIRKIFMLGKYNDILSAGDTERAYFSVLTSPNSTEITKPVLNNNTSTGPMYMYVICYDQ